MASKKQPDQPNQVWLELEKPRDAAHAQVICAAANNMLARLHGPGAAHSVFTWSEKRQRYEYGTPMGREVAVDNGMWFDLDYFGRPVEEAA